MEREGKGEEEGVCRRRKKMEGVWRGRRRGLGYTKCRTQSVLHTQVHPCGRYRHNTVVFLLGKEHNLRNLHSKSCTPHIHPSHAHPSHAHPSHAHPSHTQPSTDWTDLPQASSSLPSLYTRPRCWSNRYETTLSPRSMSAECRGNSPSKTMTSV